MSVGTLQHIAPLMRQLGLLEDKAYALTELGRAFHRLNEEFPSLLPEAVHHLLYTAHVFDETNRHSWAYAKVVDVLWASGERALDSLARQQIVAQVVDEAAQRFKLDARDVAFSGDSVRGVLKWLGALDPPAATDSGKASMFRRRYFCPAAQFLWAVDFVYRANMTAYGVRMFLTPERIDQLCKLCVLDPAGLENVLEMAKRTSDYERGGMFDYGTEGGFGSWILLAHSSTVPNLPEGGRT